MACNLALHMWTHLDIVLYASLVVLEIPSGRIQEDPIYVPLLCKPQGNEMLKTSKPLLATLGKIWTNKQASKKKNNTNKQTKNHEADIPPSPR